MLCKHDIKAAMAEGSEADLLKEITIEDMMKIHKECNYDDTLCARKLVAIKMYRKCDENSLRAKYIIQLPKLKN
ncbi:hypothetical protein ACF0H5_018272 [Mactra antiquata]